MDDPQDQFNMYIEEMLEKLRKDSDVLVRHWLEKVSTIDALKQRYPCEDSAVAELIEFLFFTLTTEKGMEELREHVV